jgi:hypothetical protein
VSGPTKGLNHYGDGNHSFSFAMFELCFSSAHVKIWMFLETTNLVGGLGQFHKWVSHWPLGIITRFGGIWNMNIQTTAISKHLPRFLLVQLFHPQHVDSTP